MASLEKQFCNDRNHHIYIYIYMYAVCVDSLKYYTWVVSMDVMTSFLICYTE